MGPAIRNRREAARWIAGEVVLAWCFTIPATLAATTWWCGGNFNGTIGERSFFSFAVAFATIATLIYTPMVEIRRIRALRELRGARDDLDRLAHTDALTGLLNRRGFDRAAARILPGARLAAIICDLDHFKQVNDRHGHDFGDTALRCAADRLRAVIGRPDSVLARIGGEEFVALIPGADRQTACALAERLRERFSTEPVYANDVCATVTLSAGVAVEENCHAPHALLAEADGALYQAKRSGRDRICVAGLTPETV